MRSYKSSDTGVVGISHWMQLLHHGAVTASLVGFCLILVVSFIPVIPIPVIAAVLGTVCPFWLAFLVCWSSSAIAATLKYFILKYILRDRAQTYLSKYPKMGNFLRFMEHNGFLAVLTARVIPIIPSSVINVTASVTKVRDRDFILATLIGKIPVMLTFVFAGKVVRHNPWLSAVMVAVYGLLILFMWNRYRVWISKTS